MATAKETQKPENSGGVAVQRFVMLLERLQVRWQNWRVRKTGRAYRHITKAMRDDPGYALSWQCNIAMPIYDGAKGKLTLPEANEIADRLMEHLFNVKQHNESSVVSHLHWTEGGTALTNFDPKDEPKYLAAIAVRGDPAFVVVRAPMDKRGSSATDYSLHCLTMPQRRDCSDFYETFRKVANDGTQRRLPPPLSNDNTKNENGGSRSLE